MKRKEKTTKFWNRSGFWDQLPIRKINKNQRRKKNNRQWEEGIDDLMTTETRAKLFDDRTTNKK